LDLLERGEPRGHRARDVGGRHVLAAAEDDLARHAQGLAAGGSWEGGGAAGLPFGALPGLGRANILVSTFSSNFTSVTLAPRFMGPATVSSVKGILIPSTSRQSPNVTV